MVHVGQCTQGNLLGIIKILDNEYPKLDLFVQWYGRSGPEQLQKHEHRAIRWRYKSLVRWKNGILGPVLFMIHKSDP